MGKRNNGPAITRYEKKPKSPSVASKVWIAAYGLFGCPPSFMRLIPANRKITLDSGEEILTKTTRWEIGHPDDDSKMLVINGPAKTVINEILEYEVKA
jgi:hypothetical protein